VRGRTPCQAATSLKSAYRPGAQYCEGGGGRVIRPKCRVLSLAMSALGWVIVAAVLIIVLVLAVVFVRRRRRAGGVIATRDKE
jgi:disulfide bond formation protein DsbB